MIMSPSMSMRSKRIIQTSRLIAVNMAEAGPIKIMGAGLSGLAAATILAKAGREVHVHDIREESGARFDGDFQALENWSMDTDFFDQMKSWGLTQVNLKRLNLRL